MRKGLQEQAFFVFFFFLMDEIGLQKKGRWGL